MKSNISYVLLHIDWHDVNSVLNTYHEGGSLAEALVFFKHHPCTRGELYAYSDSEPFDRKKAKLVATKMNSVVKRHDIEERKRKSIIVEVNNSNNN